MPVIWVLVRGVAAGSGSRAGPLAGGAATGPQADSASRLAAAIRRMANIGRSGVAVNGACALKLAALPRYSQRSARRRSSSTIRYGITIAVSPQGRMNSLQQTHEIRLRGLYGCMRAEGL